MSLTIYGASDDLIELEGDVRDEHGAYDAGTVPFVVSDGTEGTIEYAPAGCGPFWRICITTPGAYPHTLVAATDEIQDYTDRLTINGVVEWVTIARRHYPDRRKGGRRHDDGESR